MKNLFILLGIGLLLSCASENEQKALDSIAENFSAKTSYTKGFNTNNGTNITSFNIKISESKMLDSIKPALSSGAVALMGFKNFTADEKEKYNEINVEFISSKQDTSTFKYSKKTLELLLEKDIKYDRFSKAIVSKDIAILEEMVDPSILNKGHSDIIIRIVTNIEKEFGKLQGYIPSSISQSNYSRGTMISYLGLLRFEKVDVFYTCNFDIKAGENKIIGYEINPKL